MSTFSEIVDAVAQDTGRSGAKQLPSVIRAVNSTLMDFETNDSEYQRSEFAYTHDYERFGQQNAFEKCSIPLPADYQRIEAIITDLDQIVHRVKPGLTSILSKDKNRYYIANGMLHFAACFKKHIYISYFRVRRDFLYYPQPMRLIRTSLNPMHDCAYEYRHPSTDTWIPYDPTNEQMLQSFNRHTDWICDLYGKIVELGAASTLHNRSGNESIGARLYQEYQTKRTAIVAGRV